MKMKQIREKASEMGINSGKMKKIDLVHAIQIEEGNYPCFQANNDSCEQESCCWRDDCLLSGA